MGRHSILTQFEVFSIYLVTEMRLVNIAFDALSLKVEINTLGQNQYPIENWTTGVYFLDITTDSGIFQLKLHLK